MERKRGAQGFEILVSRTGPDGRRELVAQTRDPELIAAVLAKIVSDLEQGIPPTWPPPK